MTVRARAYPGAIFVLALSLLLAFPVAAPPSVVDEGNAISRVMWDFSSPGDYVTSNATLAPGNATLSKSSLWANYSSDVEFSMGQMQAANVTISSGVRLAGNNSNMIVDGTFDVVPGPWAYSNGTTNAVTAARDAGGRARLGHQTSVLRFDSMDDVFGPNPWVGDISGPGEATSILSQETTNRVEGTGSLRDEVTLLQSGGGFWGGAVRNDPLPWDWSGYDRLAIRMNKATAGFEWAWVYVEDQSGIGSLGFMTTVTGWFRYAIDLNASLDLSAINFIRIGFGSWTAGASTIYIDDILLMNSTAFAESAHVAQTFVKPFPTSGGPSALGLRFDLESTGSVNLESSLKVTVNSSVEWSQTPIVAGNQMIDLDLSGNAALRGTGLFVLEFSLQLNRTGWEEAAMTAWIDNVQLVASYENGSFESLPIDAGSPATWETVDLEVTTPGGTSVALEARSGSSASPGDASWTQWQPSQQNATQSPSNQYLQWRLLITTDGAETPAVTRLSISYGKYAPVGEIRTLPFLPTEPLVAWRQFLANQSAPGPTALAYDLSFDGGATWTNVVPGQDVSPLPTASVIVRAILTTTNTSLSPSIASWSLRYEIGASSGAPKIDGLVPDQFAQEDSPAWSLDLIRYARNQTDPADTFANLKWYVTGINVSLYTVFGDNTFGRHTIAFTPTKDAFGTDEATLWLEDRNGAKASQPLRVTIEAVNDPPVWTSVPEVWVGYEQPYTLFLIPYVTDLDTSADDLVFSTDDATHITTVGPNATYLFPRPSRTLLVRHYVTDGSSPPTPSIITIHVTDSVPPQSSRPIPDIAIIEDVKAYDVFRPDSLSDYFVDTQGEPLILTSNFTNLDVEIWEDGSTIKVNVAAKPDFCGIDRITFRATAARNTFAEYTNSVTVLCVNDPPLLGWRETVHVRFDASYRLDLSSFVVDVDDPRDSLTLTTSDPVHARASQFAITFLYPLSEFGPDPVTVPLNLTLGDGRDATSVPIQVFVSDNRPPEIVRAFDDLRFLEDTVERDVLNLPVHFADDRDPGLSYRATATNVNVTLAAGLVTLRPPPDWFGRDTLVIRAVDSAGAFALANVLIDVLPVNDAPVFVEVPDQVRRPGDQWALDLRDYVHDVDNEDSQLEFTTDSARVVAVGYVLSFSYANGSAHESVVVTVRDPGNLTANARITIRVGPSFWESIFWPWSAGLVAASGVLSYAAWRERGRRRYTIEDFMIIGHEGLLIAHATRVERAGPDSDLMAAMLTATLMFIRDSFRQDKNELQRFELSQDRVGIVQKGPHVYGVAIAVGVVPEASYLGLKEFMDRIEERYGDRLAAQLGAVDEVIPGLEAAMSMFLRRGRHRRSDFEQSEFGRYDGQRSLPRRWGIWRRAPWLRPNRPAMDPLRPKAQKDSREDALETREQSPTADETTVKLRDSR